MGATGRGRGEEPRRAAAADGSWPEDPTDTPNLHAVDTVRLAAARARWDERPTAEDQTRVDRLDEIRDAAPDSREITAESPRAIVSIPPPTTVPGSNPEPTVATKLDPGVAHLVPGTLVDAFVIDRLLGSGAMGQVYGAQHERLGRRVAIKVIAPSLCHDQAAVERFEQEAVALGRLSHPNIVGVLTVGTLPGDGRSYYAMDWLDGESLQARLDRARLPVDLALDVLDQIARGLAAAHAAGIVHRDLKPDNVFLERVGAEPRPVVRIVDFGLAKLAQHRRSEETQAGVIFGTPTYLSPEQCQSARDVGPATDVYALGVIAYELVCGRLPFVYDNVAELIAAHRTEAPPRPRDLTAALDPRLDELLLAMLAKEPAQRPALAVVRSTLAAVRTASPRTSSRIPAPRSARTRRGLLVTIASFALALLTFLVASALVRGRTDEAGAQVPDAAPRDRVQSPVRAGAVSIDAGTTGARDAAELVSPVADAARPDATSVLRTAPPPTADARGADRDLAPRQRPRREPTHAPDPTIAPPPRHDPRDQTFDPFHRAKP